MSTVYTLLGELWLGEIQEALHTYYCVCNGLGLLVCSWQGGILGCSPYLLLWVGPIGVQWIGPNGVHWVGHTGLQWKGHTGVQWVGTTMGAMGRAYWGAMVGTTMGAMGKAYWGAVGMANCRCSG